MKGSIIRVAATCTAMLFCISTLVSAQGDTASVRAERAMVTRAEIQAAIDDLQRALSSTAYSPALRTSKQAELDLLKDRLAEGDLRPGDQIELSVLGEPALKSTYDVTPSRTIVLPGGNVISVRGVLRSELQPYMTKQLSAYVRDPVVTAEALVRLQIFGAIGHPGFFNAPANMLLSQVITKYGGGPANNAQFTKSTIVRDKDQVVVNGPEFQDAIYRARTLDQLNVQAGDEIRVAAKPPTALFWRIVAGISAVSGLVYLAIVLIH